MTIATDGREGVKVWQREPFDLILMDVQMPNLNGLEATAAIRVLERLASKARYIPILAMTANTSGDIREQCFAAGMDGYLAKPAGVAELNEAIRTVFSQLN